MPYVLKFLSDGRVIEKVIVRDRESIGEAYIHPDALAAIQTVTSWRLDYVAPGDDLSTAGKETSDLLFGPGMHQPT